MIHWGRIFCFLHGLHKDFKEESSTSLLEIFDIWDSLEKNLLLPYWGYFKEKSSTSLLGSCFDVLGPIGEESFSSSIGMMLDTPGSLRKSLLLPLRG